MSVNSKSGTVIGSLASTRKEPFPSADIVGSKVAPVLARTPSRLSNGKRFTSTAAVVGACRDVHAFIASPITSARRLFFIVTTSMWANWLVELMGAYFLGQRQSRHGFPFSQGLGAGDSFRVTATRRLLLMT